MIKRGKARERERDRETERETERERERASSSSDTRAQRTKYMLLSSLLVTKCACNFPKFCF